MTELVTLECGVARANDIQGLFAPLHKERHHAQHQMYQPAENGSGTTTLSRLPSNGLLNLRQVEVSGNVTRGRPQP